jgi:hypothetical protein
LCGESQANQQARKKRDDGNGKSAAGHRLGRRLAGRFQNGPGRRDRMGPMVATFVKPDAVMTG